MGTLVTSRTCSTQCYYHVTCFVEVVLQYFCKRQYVSEYITKKKCVEQWNALTHKRLNECSNSFLASYTLGYYQRYNSSNKLLGSACFHRQRRLVSDLQRPFRRWTSSFNLSRSFGTAYTTKKALHIDCVSRPRNRVQPNTHPTLI